MFFLLFSLTNKHVFLTESKTFLMLKGVLARLTPISYCTVVLPWKQFPSDTFENKNQNFIINILFSYKKESSPKNGD